MNTKPKAGEIWFAELAMIEKSRSILVLAYPGTDNARTLTIVAPLTSQIRGMRGGINLGHPKWLPKPSAVNGQGLAIFDRHKLTRRFGKLTEEQFETVKSEIQELLGL